ncbi:hypothetical protein [uncultured Treponema sp.]|uniref:hypothetical protein n=1 Tax=uncultured Treponema sp. TaxID=162155 RepID=UPI0028EB89CC|nr:hypothetical protein [uncultured Treponema sp.]
MTKTELEKRKEKILAENPLLTEDQIEDIIAESETGDGESGSEGASHTPDSGVPDANALTQEKAALTQEREALEAEKAALAKEREKLEAEKAALVKEREELEAEKKALSEKEEAMKAAAGYPQASGADSRDNGKAVTYVCKTRCTFRGQYYREGDRLTATGKVPDFFEAVEEA